MITTVENRAATAPALFDGKLAASFRVTARTNAGTWLPVGVYRLLDDAREFADHLVDRGWDVEILPDGVES